MSEQQKGSRMVVLSAEELEELVQRALGKALANDPAPLLLDRQGLAQKLGCSPSHVDQLRKMGMPALKVGHMPRFEPARCLEWLRQQAGAA